MRYVLDVSAALCWILPRPASPQPPRLRDDSRRGTHVLIARVHLPGGGRQPAHSRRPSGRNSFQSAEPPSCLPTSSPRRPPCYAYEAFLGKAVENSSRTRSGLYDCLYVALAEREGCELVTDDQKLVANLKPQFPFIIPLASLP